jgi:hypothetical protein
MHTTKAAKRKKEKGFIIILSAHIAAFKRKRKGDKSIIISGERYTDQMAVVKLSDPQGRIGLSSSGCGW